MQKAILRGAARRWPIAAVVVTAALILSGCAASSAAPDAATPTASPSTGAISFNADELTAAFEQSATEMLVPGAVMLIRTPQGDVETAFGVTEWGGSTPITVDDHIRIGSNTKTWTGTVILQLVEEGAIALDDPVSKYRPDVPNGDNITIEQLLSMRSGLFNYTATLELNTALDVTPERVWQPEELVRLGLAEPPYFAPGTSYEYSNTNTVLLGLIAEDLEGKSMDQIFEQRLFAPLGLTETSYPTLTDTSIPEPYARGYMFSNNVDTMTEPSLSAEGLLAAAAGDLLPSEHTNDNASWTSAAGMGISTAKDLATWVEALGGGGLLSDDMQRQRIESLQPNDGGSYGWAIAGMNSFYGHIGSLPGYNSFMGYDPATEVTVVVWTTLAPGPDGRPPAADLARLLIGNLYAT